MVKDIVVLNTDLLQKFHSDEGLANLRTGCAHTTHKKYARSRCDNFFKVAGNTIQHECLHICVYELALFVRVGLKWVPVAKSNIVLSSLEILNEKAQEILEFIKENDIYFKNSNGLRVAKTQTRLRKVS